MDVLLWVLVAVLIVWIARRVRASVKVSAARRRRADLPGLSADNPLILTSARAIADARESLRCECGGEVKELGETPRLGLRVARGRCVECDADVDLYFTLPQLLN